MSTCDMPQRVEQRPLVNRQPRGEYAGQAVGRFFRHVFRAVRIAATDRRIPRWLRGLVGLGLLPIPGPVDELVLVIAAVPLALFYRQQLREAWQAAGDEGGAVS